MEATSNTGREVGCWAKSMPHRRRQPIADFMQKFYFSSPDNRNLVSIVVRLG
jgi:hypothetical protein